MTFHNRSPGLFLGAGAGLAAPATNAYCSQAMSDILHPEDKHDSPNSYLEANEQWVSFSRGLFRFGKLRSDAPPEAFLVQEISRRLRERYQKRDDEEANDEGWSFRDGQSFRKVAEPCGISARAFYDLWYGESWPTLRTLARIEMVLDEMLWNSQHRVKYEKMLERPSDDPPSSGNG